MFYEDAVTFGAKFDISTVYIGDDGKEYYRAIPNSGITITFGANAMQHVKKESGRNTKEYRKFVSDVLIRDKSACQCCGSTTNPEVHHIKPYAKFKEFRTDVNNGITLCELHHSSLVFGSFHQIYGNRNNTPEQLQKYMDEKRKEFGLPKVTLNEIIQIKPCK
jgi:hypothetical protein